MKKFVQKIIYWILAVCIVCVISILTFELILQIIPFVYRNLPVSGTKTYVYVIGESISVGHPYDSKISFSKIMRYMTDNKIDGRETEFIMLAGESERISQQYLKYFLYKYTHPFRKGIILCYMKGSGDWADKSTGYDFSLSLNFNIIGFARTYFSDKYDFAYEYERIIKLAKKFGDDMYVSTITGNYAGCMPNNVSSLIGKDNIKENIKEIDNLILNKKYNDALEKCNNLLKSKEDKSQIWYRIGKIYERQNKIMEAKEAYLNGVEYGRDTRPTRYQNRVIKKLAQKYGINLVDTAGKLDGFNEVIGYNYFIDIVHPNIKMHIFLADEFLNSLSKRHRINIINSSGGIDPEKIKSVMNFGRQDMFAAYRDALGEIFFYSFYNNITDSYNIPKMEEYIGKLKELDNEINSASEGNIKERENRKDIIYISELLFAYIQGNNLKVKEMLNDKKIVEKIKFGEMKMQCWWVFKGWIIDFMYKIINNEVV